MIDIANILQKDVICIYDCVRYGKVSSIYLSPRLKCTYMGVFHNNMEYAISTKDISSIDNDCIMIANRSSLTLRINIDKQLEDCIALNNPDVYTSTGKSCGKLKSVILDDKYNLQYIVLENNENILKDRILRINKDICILKSNEKESVSKYKPKKIPSGNIKNSIVTIQKDFITDKSDVKPVETKMSNKISIADTSLLLGRITTKQIVAINGEIIARDKAKITKEIIKKARINGKLYELIKYSA